MGSVIGYQEAHGPVATFETDVAGKIKNLVVDINPVQEGTGDPSPDNIRPITGWTGAKVAKCGKNLFDFNRVQGTPIPPTVIESPRTMETNKWYKGLRADNYYYEGYVDCTIENNVLTVHTKNNVNYGIGFPISCKPNTTYIVSAEQTGCNFSIGCYDKDWNFLSKLKSVVTYVGPMSFTTPSNAEYITVIIGSAVNGEGTATNIQIELDSTATAYEPYVGSTYDITFPSEAGTVYGGKLDVVNGELVVDRAQIASYNGETLPGEWISDRDVYAAGASPTTGAQVVYDLSTPITYQLTPQEVSTIIGTNTIYADTGDTSVIYPKTITPVETVSNVSLMELRRSIMMAMQHDFTTYGVEWYYNDPSTVLKRTGAASKFANPIPAESLNEVGWSPFDNVYPWSEIKRYNIINGEVAYSEDDAGYSETLYDTMVYIPEFYYYAYKDTANQKWNWSISAKPLKGYEKHPGSGRYVGRFHTSGSSSGVFSKGGVMPLANITRANFRTYSHNKGSNWWQIDLATWSAIQLLYLVEFANWDSQYALGYGQTSGNIINAGDTTNATYHTLKQNNNSHIYRWIENPYSNVRTFIDGLTTYGFRVYTTTNPLYYNDNANGMDNTNITLTGSGFISGFGFSEKCPYAFIPDKTISNTNVYVTDYLTSASESAYYVLHAGGANVYANYYGLFCLYIHGQSTITSENIGSRLIFIPSN